MVSGLTVTMTTLFYGLYGFYKMKWAVKDDVHAPMGLTVLSLISFIAISGAIARWKLVSSQEN